MCKIGNPNFIRSTFSLKNIYSLTCTIVKINKRRVNNIYDCCMILKPQLYCGFNYYVRICLTSTIISNGVNDRHLQTWHTEYYKCESDDGCLFYFHAITTERIYMKHFSNETYTCIRMTYRLLYVQFCIRASEARCRTAQHKEWL